ncbi:hypothetical protein F5Y18DRAFT_442118 [Xylariaceae sp. FL1019]|nr:hypothetical protein F5Y18DRAFT_442118 [Xylariaceae sp. FL1019]
MPKARWYISQEEQTEENSSSMGPIVVRSNIGDFHTIVQGHRRPLVQWVWLRLELSEYDCERCRLREAPEEETINNTMFTNALWNLFQVLSEWSSPERSPDPPRGLTLELSAHSPSDPKHFAKELGFRIDDTAWSSDLAFPKRRPQDLAHGWSRGFGRKPVMTNGARLRLFGEYRGLALDLKAIGKVGKKLPRVTVINSLVIRRQFFRAFSVPKSLQSIFKALTRLESLRYETWRGIRTNDHDGRFDRDMENHILFLHIFQTRIKTLRKVSIVEDYDTVPYYKRHKRGCMPALGLDLARTSRHFEELHAAYNVDARHFFDLFWDDEPIKPVRYEPKWPKLKYMSMTSHELMPFGNHDRLIQTAAAAALKMPELDTMELWDCHSEHGQSIFRYERRTAQQPRIQFLSTWHGQLTKEARLAWAQVASMHGSDRPLETETILLDPPSSGGRHNIIKYLHLKSRIWNETSVQQIMSEGAYKDKQ